MEAESSAKKEMKRQERLATASGFKSVKSLEKAQRMFKVRSLLVHFEKP